MSFAHFLLYFVHKLPSAYNVMKMKNFEKGNNSAMTNLIDKEKITGLLNFHTPPTYQISRSYLTVLDQVQM